MKVGATSIEEPSEVVRDLAPETGNREVGGLQAMIKAWIREEITAGGAETDHQDGIIDSITPKEIEAEIDTIEIADTTSIVKIGVVDLITSITVRENTTQDRTRKTAVHQRTFI